MRARKVRQSSGLEWGRSLADLANVARAALVVAFLLLVGMLFLPSGRGTRRARGCLLGLGILLVTVIALASGAGPSSSPVDDPAAEPPPTGSLASSPAGRVTVRPTRDGAWMVQVPEIPGASGYRVRIDRGNSVTVREPGEVQIHSAGVPGREYLPGPVHVVTVDAIGVSGVASARFCSPVLVLAARGTDENAVGNFGQGMGFHGLRFWGLLAAAAGVQLPDGRASTVLGAAGVRFPASSPLSEEGYFTSRDKGIVDLSKRLEGIGQYCPESAVVLFGFSQGADVVNAVWMIGRSTDQVIGVVANADPRFDPAWVEQGIARPADASLDRGGVLGARGVLDPTGLAILQQWCLPTDPICQVRAGVVNPSTWHGREYDRYDKRAASEAGPAVIAALLERGYEVGNRAASPDQAIGEGRSS